jgi:competence protein ComFC
LLGEKKWSKHMGYKLEGNWVAGFAYDLHTLSSEYLGQDEYGHDRYNNTRSEMGELIYQLKYQHDSLVVNKIVDLLQTIKGFDKMDVVIPIPPSNKNRANQPVYSIATEFGKRFNIPVYLDVLEKSKDSQELKGIIDPDERQKALKNSMSIANNYDFSGKNVLLLDDLYRSGSTLRIATELLYSEADAKNVYVLTMTKTRSNR